MPEVAGGWYCGRWVVGVGGAMEFEVLFNGVEFLFQRRTAQPPSPPHKS